MDIIEKLKSMGASQTQLESKTVQMVLQALAEDGSIIPDTAKLEIKTLISAVDNASDRLSKAERSMAQTIHDANAQTQIMQRAADKATREWENATRQKESVILDKDLQEAVKAYKAVLLATREVWGDVIEKAGGTEAVIAAIQAGSYTAWRGIMGPKNEDTSKKNRYL